MRRVLMRAASVVAGCALLQGASAEPAYRLAFFREVGDYENHNNHSFYAHVWDAAGNPKEGVLVRSTDGTASGTTNSRGTTEIPLYLPGPYVFEVVDGGAISDRTPSMVVNRSPATGHYSWEAGFFYKASDANVGSFDSTLRGVPNKSGTERWDLDQPTTKSVVYHYWDPYNWNADAVELADWAMVSHGQTFVIPEDTDEPIDRIVACNFQCTRGAFTKVAFGVQIHEGGPTGPAIGPVAYSRGDWSITINSDELKSFVVTWGINDNPVVPGRTYYARVFAADQPETPDVNEAAEGMNVWVCPNDNYAQGTYHHDGDPYPGRDILGYVVGAHTGESGTGTPTFVWTDNFEEVTPDAGANEWSPLNYGSLADKGTWNNLGYGHAVNNDPAAWGAGTRQHSRPNAGMVLGLSEAGAVGPGVSWAWRRVDGLTPGKLYRMSFWVSTSGYSPPPPGILAVVGYSQDVDDGFAGGDPPDSVRYPGDGRGGWSPDLGIAERCAQEGMGTPVWVSYSGDFIAEGNSVKLWMFAKQTVLHPASDPFPWRLFDMYVDDIRIEEIDGVPVPAPVFTSIVRSGTDDVVLRWSSVDGARYRVWFTESLQPVAWMTNALSEVTAAGDWTDWTDAVSGAAARYYRVEGLE